MVGGVHILDLALTLAGGAYQPNVASSLKHAGVGDADNYAKLLLTAADGPTIDIECSYYDAFPRPHYHVQGTNGTISCTGSEITAKFYNPAAAPPIELDVNPLQNAEGNPSYCMDNLPLETQSWSHNQNLYQVSFLAFYERLYNALSRTEQVPVTLEELRRQVGILDACYRDVNFSNS